jgi:hypothetical protein
MYGYVTFVRMHIGWRPFVCNQVGGKIAVRTKTGLERNRQVRGGGCPLSLSLAGWTHKTSLTLRPFMINCTSPSD